MTQRELILKVNQKDVSDEVISKCPSYKEALKLCKQVYRRGNLLLKTRCGTTARDLYQAPDKAGRPSGRTQQRREKAESDLATITNFMKQIKS